MTYEQQIETLTIHAYLEGVKRGLGLAKAIFIDGNTNEKVIRREVEASINTNRRKK